MVKDQKVEIKVIPLAVFMVVVMGLVTTGANSMLTRLGKAEDVCDLARSHIAKDDQRAIHTGQTVQDLKHKVDAVKKIQERHGEALAEIKKDIENVLNGIHRIENGNGGR